jgi:hypothetical protein
MFALCAAGAWHGTRKPVAGTFATPAGRWNGKGPRCEGTHALEYGDRETLVKNKETGFTDDRCHGSGPFDETRALWRFVRVASVDVGGAVFRPCQGMGQSVDRKPSGFPI